MTDPIPCAAGCKRSLPDMDAATQAGWECLPISGRWRCPQCRRELEEINNATRKQADE